MFFLVLTSLMTLVAIYLGLRVIRPLTLPVWARWFLFVLVLVCANKMAIYRYLVPGGFAPQVSYETLIITSWMHTSVVLGCLVGVLLDVLGIIFRRSGLRLLGARSRAVLVFASGMLLAALGLQQALKVPDVYTVDLAVRNLSPDLQGYRLALLTDIHLGPLYGAEWAHELVARTNATKANLIVIAGDLVDGSPSQLAAAAAELSGLHAQDGVYMAVGNHEYYSGLEAWLPEFARLGLNPLLNQHVAIPVGTSQLVLAALTDRAALRSGMPSGSVYAKPDIRAALAGAPTRDDKSVRIVLDHQPAGAPGNAPFVDIQLSGHTHGGLLLPLQKIVASFNNGYVSGSYDVNGMRLIVSNGAGMWAGMPLRLGVPSQILVLRLVSA